MIKTPFSLQFVVKRKPHNLVKVCHLVTLSLSECATQLGSPAITSYLREQSTRYNSDGDLKIIVELGSEFL